MSASLIDGKAIAQQVRAEVRDRVSEWVDGGGRRPGLATVLVGDDPASAVYVAGKQKACAEVGIEGFNHPLSAEVSEQQVTELLQSSTPTRGYRGSCCSCRRPRTSTARG